MCDRLPLTMTGQMSAIATSTALSLPSSSSCSFIVSCSYSSDESSTGYINNHSNNAASTHDHAKLPILAPLSLKSEVGSTSTRRVSGVYGSAQMGVHGPSVSEVDKVCPPLSYGSDDGEEDSDNEEEKDDGDDSDNKNGGSSSGGVVEDNARVDSHGASANTVNEAVLPVACGGEGGEKDIHDHSEDGESGDEDNDNDYDDDDDDDDSSTGSECSGDSSSSSSSSNSNCSHGSSPSTEDEPPPPLAGESDESEDDDDEEEGDDQGCREQKQREREDAKEKWRMYSGPNFGIEAVDCAVSWKKKLAEHAVGFLSEAAEMNDGFDVGSKIGAGAMGAVHDLDIKDPEQRAAVNRFTTNRGLVVKKLVRVNMTRRRFKKR